MSIGTLCNREVIVTGPDTSAQEAARLMRSHHVGDLIVVEDTNGARRPLGMVTDRDLVVEVMAQRMAALQALMNSMTPEQRAQLQALSDQLLEDLDLRWQMDQLGDHLRELFPDAGWGRQYQFSGVDPLDLAEAAQLMGRKRTSVYGPLLRRSKRRTELDLEVTGEGSLEACFVVGRRCLGLTRLRQGRGEPHLVLRRRRVQRRRIPTLRKQPLRIAEIRRHTAPLACRVGP